MKKIIGNKVYDTDTAEALGEWKQNMIQRSLYRTKKGAFFVVSSFPADDEPSVLPVSEDELFDWLVQNGGDEQAARLFPDRVEEA